VTARFPGRPRIALAAAVLLVALTAADAVAQSAAPRDTAAENAAIRRADSIRIANRPCLHTDVLMNVCKRQDTVYVNGKATAVLRRPGVALDPPSRVDTVYLDRRRNGRLAARPRVDTVYVERLPAASSAPPR
jgi:hypothetical protein